MARLLFFIAAGRNIRFLFLVFCFLNIFWVLCLSLTLYLPLLCTVHRLTRCWVLNYTYQWHCYSPKYHDISVNSFVTGKPSLPRCARVAIPYTLSFPGFWDNEASFFVMRKVVDDQQSYKCCKTPQNYYIDYMSCYFMPTRDQYGKKSVKAPAIAIKICVKRIDIFILYVEGVCAVKKP